MSHLERHGRRLSPGCLWITGLSASGKTTVSTLVHSTLLSHFTNLLLLDGDQLRRVFGKATGNYGRKERIETALTYSRLVKELSEQGAFVIIAVIGMHEEVYTWNNDNIDSYRDVFLDVPVEELFRRDPKGLYKKFKANEIRNIAGLDLKIDMPQNPWLHVRWPDGGGPEEIASSIIHKLKVEENFSSSTIQSGQLLTRQQPGAIIL